MSETDPFQVVRRGTPSQLEAVLTGTDCTVTNEAGQTLLHQAAARGRREMTEMLLERDIDLNATDDDGQTPLHYACARRSDHVVGDHSQWDRTVSDSSASMSST